MAGNYCLAFLVTIWEWPRNKLDMCNRPGSLDFLALELDNRSRQPGMMGSANTAGLYGFRFGSYNIICFSSSDFMTWYLIEAF